MVFDAVHLQLGSRVAIKVIESTAMPQASGQRPFAGASPYELMHEIVTGSCPRPTELQPTLEPDVGSNDAPILD